MANQEDVRTRFRVGAGMSVADGKASPTKTKHQTIPKKINNSHTVGSPDTVNRQSRSEAAKMIALTIATASSNNRRARKKSSRMAAKNRHWLNIAMNTSG